MATINNSVLVHEFAACSIGLTGYVCLDGIGPRCQRCLLSELIQTSRSHVEFMERGWSSLQRGLAVAAHMSSAMNGTVTSLKGDSDGAP